MGLFASWISPYDPTERVGRPFERPSERHLLGTNDVGQDILSEIIYGSRISLFLGFLAALIALSIGTVVGIVSGYCGGLMDSILMRIVDIILVIPFLPLMILLAAHLGPSFWNLVFVLSVLIWAQPARVIRAQVLSLKERGYVMAARSTGGTVGHILLHHILPAVLPLSLAQLILAARSTILTEAAISFLGLGDPLAKSWGTVLYYAQVRGAFLTDAWLWWILPPGLLITAAVLGFTLTGYVLEEMVNPRLRKGR
jgi:ABC-type dipeptide/oligopeptide/nickel transport system permease subunit